MLSDYKRALAQICPDFFRSNDVKWQTDPKWLDVLNNVDQTILNDAFSYHTAILTTFPNHVQSVTSVRQPKKMERILVKRQQVTPMWFKVVSDFLAFRVKENDVENISTTVDVIKQSIRNADHEAVFYDKGSYVNENNTTENNTTQKYTDIVQYFYSYVPSIGHVAEFQVGHELAAYTFRVDSALRDNPNCGEVDLWTNGVYQKLKNRILEDANQQPHTVSKYDLYDAVWTLHSKYNKEPTQELRNILDTICEKKQ